MLHLPGGGESMYGVGHSLLAIPPILISTLLRNKFGIHCEGALYTLIFVVNGALLLGLIAYYLSHFYSSKRVWMTVAVIGLATFWWAYTKLDFTEPLLLTLLFAGFVMMRFGRPVLESFVASFAITLREDAALLVGLLLICHVAESRKLSIVSTHKLLKNSFWAIQRKNQGGIRSEQRSFIGFLNATLYRARVTSSGAGYLINDLKLLLATVPAIAIVMSANWTRYGSVLNRGYSQYTFSNPFLVGIYGILFSAGKSVFLFSPPLILGIICWNRFRQRFSADAWFFLGVLIIQVVEFSKWWDWSSDDGWGVRFMIVSVVLMCIPLVEVRRPSSVLLVAALGMGIQLLPVMAGGLDYLVLARQEPSHRRALYVSGVNRVDFEDIRFNPQYSQINGTWLMVRSLLGVPPRPSDSAETGTSLYDAFAPEAWRKASQWDFIWMRRENGR